MGRPTEPWTDGGPQWAFPVDSAYYDGDDGTDTDTSSDDGRENIARPDVSNMSDAEASLTIYMAYRNAKTNWRRFTGKLVRKFRRHFRRHMVKGKGKGKAKAADSFGHMMMSRSSSKAKERAIAPTPLAVALVGRGTHVDATAQP